tara:strand:- start:166 stop:303 length:138 start_codon:yes stop_codon:yes gene_type:complete
MDKYKYEDIEPIDPLGAWKGLINLMLIEFAMVSLGLLVWWLASWT